MSEFDEQAFERSVLADIDRDGWSAIAIPQDDCGPAFAYSVGIIHTLGHPEVIIFGQKIDLMHRLINDIGAEIRSGRRFDQAGLYDGLLEGYACKFAPVAERFHTTYFGYAMWHRRHVGQPGTLRAMQCIWPDRHGLFPDKPGCNEVVISRQPLLQ